ncbi:MAG: DNA methyltransferase [Planctomycetes bacterium]|nr:DNA methyltransferase [Planctomycetota bacterium]
MAVSTSVKSLQDEMRKDPGTGSDVNRISQLAWIFFLKVWDEREKELEVFEPDYVSPLVDAAWEVAGTRSTHPDLRWRAWAADPEGATGDELLAFVNGTLFPALENLELGPRVQVVDEATAAADRLRRRKALLREVFADNFQYMKNGVQLRKVLNRAEAMVSVNDLKARHLFGDVYEKFLRDLQSAGNAGEYYTPRAVTTFAVEMTNPRLGESVLDPACGTGGFLTAAIEHIRRQDVKTGDDERRLEASIHGVEKMGLPHLLCMTNAILHGVDLPTRIVHGNTLARPVRDIDEDDQVDIVVTNPPFGGVEEDGIETNFPKDFQTKETATLFLAMIVELLKDGGRCAIVLPDGSLFGDGVLQRVKKHLVETCDLHTIVRLPKGVFAPYTPINTNVLFFEKGRPTEAIWYYEQPLPEGMQSYGKTRPFPADGLDECKAWWGEDRSKRQETERAWRVPIEEVVAKGFNLDFKNPNAKQDEIPDPETLVAQFTADRAAAIEARTSLRNVLGTAIRDAAAGKTS